MFDVLESFEIFQKTFASNTVPSNNNVSDRPTGRKTHKSSPQKIDRAKSRETTPRPMPGDVISSEDETPCYEQSMAPPNWIKTLGKYDKSANTDVKKNTESESDDTGLESGKIEINFKEELQEFDCSIKGKKKKKPRKAKSNNTTVDQNGTLKENQNHDAPKNKTKSASNKSNIKVPSIVRKVFNLIFNFRFKCFDNYSN